LKETPFHGELLVDVEKLEQGQICGDSDVPRGSFGGHCVQRETPSFPFAGLTGEDSSATGWWHRNAWAPSLEEKGGSISGATLVACAQRSAKRQPSNGPLKSGGRPGMVVKLSSLPSRAGMESSSASVYRWRGR